MAWLLQVWDCWPGALSAVKAQALSAASLAPCSVSQRGVVQGACRDRDKLGPFTPLLWQTWWNQDWMCQCWQIKLYCQKRVVLEISWADLRTISWVWFRSNCKERTLLNGFYSSDLHCPETCSAAVLFGGGKAFYLLKIFAFIFCLPFNSFHIHINIFNANENHDYMLKSSSVP